MDSIRRRRLLAAARKRVAKPADTLLLRRLEAAIGPIRWLEEDNRDLEEPSPMSLPSPLSLDKTGGHRLPVVQPAAPGDLRIG